MTGDRAWAGTDADVYVTLIGKNGLRSGDTSLDNADSNFEQGKTDTFDVTLRDVGDLDCIQISHDNSGAYPGWFLVGVAVEHLPTHRVWTCRCNRWLAFDEDDHRISRILPALSYPLGLRQSLTRIGRRPPVRIPSELKVPSKSLREP